MPSSAWRISSALLVLGVSLIAVAAYAYPSGGKYPPTFRRVGGYWYDSWGLSRNYYGGEGGYLPNMLYESIGEAADLAYSWGVQFKKDYPDEVARAKAILRYVQQWTLYGLDEDYVVMDGEPQSEWAWNGDEMAYMIRNAISLKGAVRGDCEDVSFLCATMYLGAGFDVAIVDAPNHVAVLVWLPKYPDANVYWDLEDGRGKGWIWVEATGRTNPLGWTPPEFKDGGFSTFVFKSTLSERIQIGDVAYSPPKPTPKSDVEVTVFINHTQAEVLNVTLAYSVDSGIEVHTQMRNVTSMMYQGTIPGQRDESSVEFYVEAFGKSGEVVKSQRFSYRVEDLILGVDATLFYLVVIIAGLLTSFYVAARWLMRRRVERRTARRTGGRREHRRIRR